MKYIKDLKFGILSAEYGVQAAVLPPAFATRKHAVLISIEDGDAGFCEFEFTKEELKELSKWLAQVAKAMK